MMKTQQMQNLPFGNHPQFGVSGSDFWTGLRFPLGSQEPVCGWASAVSLGHAMGGPTWPGARSHVSLHLSHPMPAGPSVACLGLGGTFHVTKA